MGQLEQIEGLPFRRAHPENLIFLLECDSPGIQIYLGVLGFRDISKGQPAKGPLGHMWGEAATGSEGKINPRF